MESKSIREALQDDMAEMFWLELERLAPSDSVIVVDGSIDLLEVGEQIAADNTERVSAWLEGGKVYRPNETQLEVLRTSSNRFLCVIVKPFVLAQEITVNC